MALHKEEEIPALTGVRFLAVTMIFLTHNAGAFSPFFTNVFGQFYLGVQLFFVLSGFLICYKYYDNANLSGTFLPNFFIKRFARIYPLFFFFTTATYLSWYFNDRPHSLTEYLLNVTFLKAFSDNYADTGVYVTWSLCVEETFYFLAPLIFLIHKRSKLLFTQIVGLYLTGALLFFFFHLFPFDGFFGSFRLVANATFFGRCFEFFAGIWLALLIKKQTRRKETKHKWPVCTYLGLLGLMAVVAVLSLYFNERPIPDNKYGGKLIVANIIFPVFTVLFFYGLIYERSILRKFLSLPVVLLLGKSSYAFYLIHASFVEIHIRLLFPGINIGVMYVTLYLASILTFLAFEQPVRRKIYAWSKRRFLRRREMPAVAPVAGNPE